MRLLPGCALTASLIGSTLSAQVVESGAVIRAKRTGSDGPLVGTLVARTPDTLTIALKSGGLVKIPASGLQSVEVSAGRRRLAPGLKWAAIGGGIWGVIASAIPYRPCDPARYSNCNENNTMSKSEFVTTQAVGMAIITGAVGAIRGSEEWTRVEGRTVSAFVRPSRGIASLGFRLRL